MGAAVRNAMTIDVEDYFQVSAFAPHISRESWPQRECRVEANIDRVLSILDEGNAEILTKSQTHGIKKKNIR